MSWLWLLEVSGATYCQETTDCQVLGPGAILHPRTTHDHSAHKTEGAEGKGRGRYNGNLPYTASC